MSKSMIEASTLILSSLKCKPYNTAHNYNVLLLMRSDKSKFMPKGYVFPGGTTDPSDSCEEWKSLFVEGGFSDSTLVSLCKDVESLPLIFQQKESQLISKLISLRITAIRETFEEAGVLIARNFGDTDTESNYACSVSLPDLSNIRKKVHKNPSAFIDVCRESSIVPDLWGLKLWSNWITPPGYNKRFNTSMFTACLENEPAAQADCEEISNVLLRTPAQLLISSAKSELWLPPPQQYELSRIFPFYMLEDFARFSFERETYGCETFEHLRMNCKDGMFVAFKGDDLYGEADENKYKQCTFEELRKMCTRLHRMEMFEPTGRSRIVTANVSPTFGHVLPVSVD